MVETSVDCETEKKFIDQMFPPPKGGGVEGEPIVLRVFFFPLTSLSSFLSFSFPTSLPN